MSALCIDNTDVLQLLQPKGTQTSSCKSILLMPFYKHLVTVSQRSLSVTVSPSQRMQTSFLFENNYDYGTKPCLRTIRDLISSDRLRVAASGFPAPSCMHRQILQEQTACERKLVKSKCCSSNFTGIQQIEHLCKLNRFYVFFLLLSFV